MISYTQGDSRPTLTQDDLTTYQGNGSVVLNSQRTRPFWFDGRFLAARDLAREQDYFLQRQSDLGQAAGFGVVHGLWVQTPDSPANPNASADTVVIGAGQGVTPSGELVLLPSDLTIMLSDLADEENLDAQFGISAMPKTPTRNRSGLFVLALRPVEFTANPIVSYPTTIQGTRTTHDGDIVEATAVTLVPYPDPVSSYDATLRRTALARQIFVTGNAAQLSSDLLPIAMVSLQRGAIEWVDPYLVRRDTGPEYSGLRFGLTDPAAQRAFMMQYDAQLQETMAARKAAALSANFSAANYFQALPQAARFPLASISVTGPNAAATFSQTFFPAQLDVRLSIIPVDEIAALIADSMSLPPLDLTLPQDAYANLAVFALIPVARADFATLKNSLPVLAPTTTLPQVLSFRPPIELLRLYQGASTGITPSASANATWASAIGTQVYGYYVRRRATPTFVDFSTPSPS
ncbi:MAG: hypothetical protein WB615_08090 [Candidatus Tumulicola sp.]